MPPQPTSEGGGARRGRPKGGKNSTKAAAKPSDEDPPSSNPFASSDNEEDVQEVETEEGRPRAIARGAGQDEDEDQQPDKTIPRDLLTRLLHEFFAKDATRISKDANAAVGKYVDVFVKEAIARTAVEKRGGFLEVEDLEKVTPQLLLDL